MPRIQTRRNAHIDLSPRHKNGHTFFQNGRLVLSILFDASVVNTNLRLFRPEKAVISVIDGVTWIIAWTVVIRCVMVAKAQPILCCVSPCGFVYVYASEV